MSAPDAGALLRELPGDPYLRWRIAPEDISDAMSRDGHAAWTHRTEKGERWATALGPDPMVVTALLAGIESRGGIDGITVHDTVMEALPAQWQGADPGHWSAWTLDAHPPSPGTAVRLSLGDARIDALLAHSPSSYIGADDPRVVAWAGVIEAGELLSVAGAIREASGAWHLVSVCTAPAARGRGLAADPIGLLCAEAAAQAAPCVFLEMYVGNVAGSALYRRLGFVERARYRSWVIGGEHPGPA